MKISATIITLNEQDNIARCIESLQEVAEEIVVVDSFSTDKTEDICKNYNVKFIKQKFLGYTKQKNFAAEQTSNDYVLNIDADEYLSKKLTDSIQKIKQSKDLKAGYKLKRLNNFWGHWVRTCGLYPDKQLRLYNKNLGEFVGDYVHEKVSFHDVSLPIGILSGNLLHLSFSSKQGFKHQLDKYANLKASEYKSKGKDISYFTAIAKALWRFLKDYVFLLGFVQGSLGFFICYSYAQYEYKKCILAKK
ncbi:MAG: glycosyltransferase family 2 protein [Bacteroidota bacterium]|nr:glycosyltransferase family 2 protein [Bacteroidota bacterium]